MKRNTKRERKIAKFKGAGLSTYEIAQVLGMKQPNVQRTLTRLKREMNKKREQEESLIEMSNRDLS